MRELYLDEEGNVCGLCLVAEKETRNGWKIRKEDLPKIAQSINIQQIVFNELPDTTCHPELRFASGRIISAEVVNDAILIKVKPLQGYKGASLLEQIVRESGLAHFCFSTSLMGDVTDGYANDPIAVATSLLRRNLVE